MPDATSRLTDALADRYRIEREIGAGGMATVHLAEDLKHHRQVAIKVLRPELGSSLGAERFLAEIRTTANLQHPNIRPLFDSGAISLLDPHDPRRFEKRSARPRSAAARWSPPAMSSWKPRRSCSIASASHPCATSTTRSCHCSRSRTWTQHFTAGA